MLYSIYIYLSLMLLMMVFSWIAGKDDKLKYFMAFIASLLFGIVFGIRYNVGVDFPTYYHEYELASHGYYSREFLRWEIAYREIFKFYAINGFHYSFAFGTIAFIQCYLIYLGLRDFSKVWVFIPLTLILSCIWLPFCNIMRHFVAFSLLVSSIPYLAEKKYIYFLFIVFIASLFHTSAIILFILAIIYKLHNPIKFIKIKYQLIFVFISLILMNIDMVQTIFENLSFIIDPLGYGNYMSGRFAGFNEDTNFGSGFIVIFLLNIFLILNSNIIKNYFRYNNLKYKIINIIYELFFVGIILKYSFIRMFLIQRINYYFITFDFIFGAMALYVLYKKKYNYKFLFLIFLYFIQFFGKMVRGDSLTATYKTFFD